MVRPLRLIGHCVQIILVYRNANDKSTTHGMVISVDASNCWHHLGRTATARVKSCWLLGQVGRPDQGATALQLPLGGPLLAGEVDLAGFRLL